VQRPAVKLGERGYHVEGHLISAGSDFSQLVERIDALEKFPSVSEKDVVKVSDHGVLLPKLHCAKSRNEFSKTCAQCRSSDWGVFVSPLNCRLPLLSFWDED
jgi:hypothetical protein